MNEGLHKYLVLHKKLYLPGVGSFMIQQTNASIDVANKTVHPPLPVISFNTKVQHKNRHAQQNMNDAGAALTADIHQHKHAVLPGVGSLQKDEKNSISFHPAYNLEDYYPAIIAERIIHKNDAHTILVGDAERTNIEMQNTLAKPAQKAKDRWMLYAILLAAAGIAALIYYHAVH